MTVWAVSSCAICLIVGVWVAKTAVAAVGAGGWGDDAVHAQVLDHLPVVIHGMESADSGDPETRGEEREHRLGQRRDRVFGGDGGKGAMAEREGVLQVLHDFGFGLQLGGPVGVLRSEEHTS